MTTSYENDSDLYSIQKKFEQLATQVSMLTSCVPKLEAINSTVDKFQSFHEVHAQAIAMVLSCYRKDSSFMLSQETSQLEPLSTNQHVKSKKKPKHASFERTLQAVLDTLPRQYRSKKDHSEKLQKILHCLYQNKDQFLTTQEISGKTGISNIHVTMYMNMLHKIGKACIQLI